MKIKRVTCGQFAGLQGKECEFADGLNLVVGENESGKSTMAELIYHLLFKDAKLDGRSAADFFDNFFPKKTSGPQIDSIDGALAFETAEGVYRLKKEWEVEVVKEREKERVKGREGSCRLTLPDGTSLKGNAAIHEILDRELKYRAGVYREIVFASGRQSQIAVESILSAYSKKDAAREDLTSTLRRVSLETGGISLEKLEKAIEENLDRLKGRWDFRADAPEADARGGTNRRSYQFAWEKGTGAIVKAYYEMDRVRDMQLHAEQAEKAVEAAKAESRALGEKKKEAEEEKAVFQKYRGLLGQASLLRKANESLKAMIREEESALFKWPHICSDVARANVLLTKQKQAAAHELFLRAAAARQSLLEKQTAFCGMKKVEPSDIKNLRDLISEKQKAGSRLDGLNLVAKIHPLGADKVEVKAALSGRALEGIDGEYRISEAVDIAVPGVVEIQLMPQGVDVDAIKAQAAQCEAGIREIYGKYHVSSSEELQALADDYAQAGQEAELRKLAFDGILGGYTWEAVEAANRAVPADIRTEAEIRAQLESLCGRQSADAFIGGMEQILRDYESRYESVENLRAMIDRHKKELEANLHQLDTMDGIPEKFRGIDDMEAYDARLQDGLEAYEAKIRDCEARLGEASRELGEKSAEEYAEELQEKQAVFEARKAEYAHWHHIYEVFCRVKEQSAGNPIEDIEEKFREYLHVITDGGIALASMDGQLSVRLASGTHALSYGILSDGTKDTVSLAFRLSMLEHLYPDGDGLAIFDDPFTDMDPKRVEQSCRLIQKFAERNQVIFITCDDKYKRLLSGNVIQLLK